MTVLEAARALWDYHRLGRPVEGQPVEGQPVKAGADAVVGLGSYDLRVADRCVELWKAGTAPLVVFSGARGNWTQGLDDTEAQIFGRRALAAGLPASAMVLEDRSTNLGENIRLTLEVLGGRNLAPQRLVVVTKPNTERRALATALRLAPEVAWTVTSPDTALEGPYAPGRTFEALVEEMVGDLERILRYPDLGFQVPQEVPAPVWKAWEFLKASGFTGHLMKAPRA